jgi:hypothetical protein
MFESTKPVTNYDLEMLRNVLNLDHGEFCHLLGIQLVKWWTMRNDENIHKPVKDPLLAITARWLMEHPEHCPPLAKMTPMQLREMLLEEHGVEIDENNIGPMFGRHATAKNRWADGTDNISPSIRHSILILNIAIEKMGAKRAVADWMKTVQTEANARGIEDVFRSRHWNPDKKPRNMQAKTRKKPGQDAKQPKTVKGSRKSAASASKAKNKH